MRILGIDPGVATTGWAVVDFEGRNVKQVLDFGVVETSKHLEIGERLSEIYDDLTSIVKNFKPEAAGIETLLFYNNAKTAIQVGEARGIVLLVVNQNDIPAYDYTPLQVKNSISGYGQANKRQVQENVKSICNLPELPKPDDAADAIALAICCNDSIVLNNLSKLNLVS